MDAISPLHGLSQSLKRALNPGPALYLGRSSAGGGRRKILSHRDELEARLYL